MEHCRIIKRKLIPQTIAIMEVPFTTIPYRNGDIINNKYIVYIEGLNGRVKNSFNIGESIRLYNLEYVEFFESIYYYINIPTIKLIGQVDDGLYRYQSLIYRR